MRGLGNGGLPRLPSPTKWFWCRVAAVDRLRIGFQTAGNVASSRPHILARGSFINTSFSRLRPIDFSDRIASQAFNLPSVHEHHAQCFRNWSLFDRDARRSSSWVTRSYNRNSKAVSNATDSGESPQNSNADSNLESIATEQQSKGELSPGECIDAETNVLEELRSLISRPSPRNRRSSQSGREPKAESTRNSNSKSLKSNESDFVRRRRMCYYYTHGQCSRMDDPHHMDMFSHELPDLTLPSINMEKVKAQPFDYLLILDLEGKIEVLEFPVIVFCIKTFQPISFFHRFVRPVKMSEKRIKEYIDEKYGKFGLSQ